MSVSKSFKETIKAYLEKRAAEDELFAVTYKKENKNLDECCNYVVKCAKEFKSEGYTDEEVFGWAVHYYDEDDIKDIKPEFSRVVVNHVVDLTDEDKAAAKEKAINDLVEEEKKKMTANKGKKPEPAKEQSKVQTLF